VDATDRQNPLTVTENIVEAEEDLKSNESYKEFSLINPQRRLARPLSSKQNNFNSTERPTRIVKGRPKTAKVSNARGRLNRLAVAERTVT